MGDAIGQILSLGVVVSLSPFPIIGIVLMLGTPRARSNGPAFIVGWIAGLAVVGGALLLVASAAGASDHGDPATWVSVVELVLGALLVLLGVKQWRGRPRGGEADLPKWMAAIDTFTPLKAAGTGALLAGVNPKNLVLILSAVGAIAQTGIDAGSQAVALAVFVVVSTIGPAVPVAIYFAMGDAAARLLDEIKTWLGANNAAIMAVMCLVIGVKIVGDGVSGV